MKVRRFYYKDRLVVEIRHDILFNIYGISSIIPMPDRYEEIEGD